MVVRSTLREIRNSLARYLAIFAIVALGVGFFSGLKVCRECMVRTADRYLDDHNMYDYRIMTSYGVDDESVQIAEAEAVVTGAEGSVQIDVMVQAKRSEAGSGSGDTGDQTEPEPERALKAISMPQDINTLSVVSGRLPEREGECVVDSFSMDGSGYEPGDMLILTESNDIDRLGNFKHREYKVVGTVDSPIYLDYQRGSTDIGNGSLSAFFYIDKSEFDVNYYTQLYLTLDGDAKSFTDEKKDEIDAAKDHMEDLADRIADARRETATAEARQRISNAAGDVFTLITASANDVRKTEVLKEFSEEEAELDRREKRLAEKREALLSEGAGEDESNREVSENTTGSELEKLEREQEKIDSKRQSLYEERDRAILEFEEAERKLADAREILEYLKSDMDEMETGNSYAVSVYEDPGYSSFDSNSAIVSNIAKVFPAFFFLIAALVCMTTMTRMIDEQRTQAGILKALGYSNPAIAGKYLAYSGSAAILGSVTGFFIGCRLFPLVIWHAYGMMYGFAGDVDFVLDAGLGIIALICSLVCTTGATWLVIGRDFRVPPAELIRPRTPPSGKRILLEYITPLWSRISFLYKVSIRNIFRDKKRFLMMVIGVSGCTALLIAGMGIGTSVADVADHQFDEISLFDYRVIFSKDMNAGRQQDFEKYMSNDADVSSDEILFLHQSEVTLMMRGGDSDVTCTAADEAGFRNFIDLHDAYDPVDFPGEGEVVIVKNLKRTYDLEPGDVIKVRDGYREAELTVSGVCDNYMYDTIYMSKSTYENAFGVKPEIKSALVRINGAEGERAAEDVVRETATVAANYDHTAAVTVNLDQKDAITRMMESLDLVTYAIILSAALLAFIVLYNLTNINITERIREIATIKVLGFNQLEVSQYVFRENIFMTAIAAVVGVFLGKWLLSFAMDNVAVKMLYFEARLTGMDIAKAVVLTFVFSALVNLAMQRRLRNVSMTESLKSIE